MNEQLTEAVSNLIDKTINGVDHSINFLSGEIPQYIIELLWWAGAHSFITTFLAVIFLITMLRKGVTWHVNLFAKLEKLDAEPVIIIPAFLSVIGVAMALCSLSLTWLQILIAPRVYLVEYAAKLIGN